MNDPPESLTGNPDETEDVIKRLFDSSYRGLVYFAFKIIGDKLEAEDIVQDAFVQYLNRRDSLSTEIRAVKSYLYTMVRNAALNWLRHQRVVRDHQTHFSGEMEAHHIEHLILEAEVMATLHEAISTLPPVCQRVMRMGHLEGLKNEEIAAELGISVNSVKTHKQRGLQLLRQKLVPELFLSLLVLSREL